jgi:hypothetical protein
VIVDINEANGTAARDTEWNSSRMPAFGTKRTRQCDHFQSSGWTHYDGSLAPSQRGRALPFGIAVAIKAEEPHEKFMNRLLIIGSLLISTSYAQAQQPDTAKLKTDAQKVVGSIRGDKAKSQAYCQLDSLGVQIDQATQQKDTKKVEALSQRADELEKQLGPEYRMLFDALNDADPDSTDVQDILSMFDKLDSICSH